MALTNLNKDAVFGKPFADFDPATTFDGNDGVLIYQAGTLRRGTITQFQDGFLTENELNSHLTATNPHNVTAAQVGALTSQQTTAAINASAATTAAAATAGLAAHLAAVNPHNITSDTVGRSISQWNANKIRGVTVDVPVNSWAAGDMIVHNGTNFVVESAFARFNKTYPIGSIYLNATNAQNPTIILGFGTWARLGQGRVLVGFDPADTDFNAAGKSGGAKTVTLTNEQMRHKHRTSAGSDEGTFYGEGGANGAPFGNEIRYGPRLRVGGNALETLSGRYSFTDINAALDAGTADPHPNMQPYITVFIWSRTA
ncbi:MAG: hypothetical protein U5M23_00350 [Marinagarivorans sp.]|nr:hypothetical protein [Marinagarivorans sp.]